MLFVLIYLKIIVIFITCGGIMVLIVEGPAGGWLATLALSPYSTNIKRKLKPVLFLLTHPCTLIVAKLAKALFSSTTKNFMKYKPRYYPGKIERAMGIPSIDVAHSLCLAQQLTCILVTLGFGNTRGCYCNSNLGGS